MAGLGVKVCVCSERELACKRTALTTLCQSVFTTMADRNRKPEENHLAVSTTTGKILPIPNICLRFVFILSRIFRAFRSGFFLYFPFISTFFSLAAFEQRTATITATVINFVVFLVRCNKLFYTTQTTRNEKERKRRKKWFSVHENWTHEKGRASTSASHETDRHHCDAAPVSQPTQFGRKAFSALSTGDSIPARRREEKRNLSQNNGMQPPAIVANSFHFNKMLITFNSNSTGQSVVAWCRWAATSCTHTQRSCAVCVSSLERNWKET